MKYRMIDLLLFKKNIDFISLIIINEFFGFFFFSFKTYIGLFFPIHDNQEKI